MSEPSQSVQAKVIHKLPVGLLTEIGRVVVAYSRLEHEMTAVIAMTLQLQKPEARLVLDEPPIHDRLNTIQDLFALKGLLPDFPFEDAWNELKAINTLRNMIAHGIWLRHPETKKVWLRLTGGHWKRTEAFQPKVRRIIRPESAPMDSAECKAIRLRIEAALKQIQVLGAILDNARRTFPERFRPPAPVVDPLARRTADKRRPPPKS
ncbi:MAG TPA: hypothetical protein VHZ78_04845 [Rhizomicrobium sp.]|jgi:hypothetical protein|nr:hypothetical protein [Rhizomicrobium sp.]